MRILTAERLAAIGAALGGPAYERELETGWKNLLVAQHHDIQICGLEDDARRFLGRSLETADGVIHRVMSEVGVRIGSPAARQVVFNPLPWRRSVWVPAGAGEEGGSVVELPGLGFTTITVGQSRSGEGRAAFEWQPEARSDDLRVRTRQKTVSGDREVWAYERVGSLQTPFYEVCTAPGGGFRLLRDRRTGQHLMAPPRNSGTLAGIINGKDCISVGSITQVKTDSARAVMTEEGHVADIPYRFEWTFYRHTPRIDWHAELEFQGQMIGRPKVPISGENSTGSPFGDPATVTAFDDHEYKLRLRFYPFQGPRVTGVRDLPFHVSETAEPYVQGIYWTAVSDGQVGLALLNRGQMGSVREQDGAFSSILAFSLPYVWNTRILKGKYTYDLGILPFQGKWQAADLHRQALDYNFPCLTQRVTGQKESLGESWTPFQQLAPADPILSALYSRNGRVYARFYESRGEEAEVGFRWLGRPIELTAVDLRERGEARLGHRARLGPWQVQTYAINKA